MNGEFELYRALKPCGAHEMSCCERSDRCGCRRIVMIGEGALVLGGQQRAALLPDQSVMDIVAPDGRSRKVFRYDREHFRSSFERIS